MNDDHLHCRVCGYKYDEPPWGQDGKTPSFDICPCCGAEFGYEDNTPLSARRYRAKWLSSGAPWWRPEFKPERWNLDDQLKNRPPGFDD
jgi:hypothetical protein